MFSCGHHQKQKIPNTDVSKARPHRYVIIEPILEPGEVHDYLREIGKKTAHGGDCRLEKRPQNVQQFIKLLK